MSRFHATPEQQRVISAPYTEKLLVLAGAGTGKTETLVRRTEHLIDCEGLEHGSVLILSFSRAAVRELKSRLVRTETDARFVCARTFDSFATRILMNSEVPDPAPLNYLARIRRVTALFESGQATELLTDYRHLIVDEAQDLVGERQLLVRALLAWITSHDGGFSLFSDPAQGIYDWQENDSKSPVFSRELVPWLRSRFSGQLLEEIFDKDFRFETDDAQVALWARKELLAKDPDFRRILDGLLNNVRDLPCFTLRERSPALKRTSEKVALVTRTNAAALLLSRELSTTGVPHYVQRDLADRSLAAWLAVVFRGLESPHISKADFLSRCREAESDGPDDPEWAWLLLRRRVDRGPGNSLSLTRVNASLTVGDFPDELTEAPDGRVVISTIHRAKGLQFPAVMLAFPSDDGFYYQQGLNVAEEARVLYVALTRASRDLERLDDPQGHLNQENGRWRELHWGRGGNFPVVVGFEVTPDDTDPTIPFGANSQAPDRVAATQRYIQMHVKPGDVVVARRLSRPSAGTDCYRYEIWHAHTPVAITSEEAARNFRNTLWPPKAYGNFKLHWPDEMTGLYVEGIETVVGSNATSMKHQLGVSGMWLRVRISGLAQWRYGKAS
jgi:hypothetical protein